MASLKVTLDETEKTNLPKEEKHPSFVQNFLDVEHTLNELFDGVLRSKVALHLVMNKLQGDLVEMQSWEKKFKQQDDLLEGYKKENDIPKAEIKKLKDPQNTAVSNDLRGNTGNKDNLLEEYKKENDVLKAEIKKLKDPQNKSFSSTWR